MARKKKVEPRKILSEAEMVKFDLNFESNKRRKLELEAIDLKKKILEQQKMILQKDIALLETSKVTIQERHRAEKYEHARFYDDLCKELELEKGFGFNPDTGEIVND